MKRSKDWKKLASVTRDNRYFYYHKKGGFWVRQLPNFDWELTREGGKGYPTLFTGATAQECMDAVESNP